MTTSVEKNFDFYLTLNLDEYAGKWIAILDNKIIAIGKSFTEVFEKAKSDYPNKRPLFDYVSESANHFLK